jgi:hypothetical protein
MYAKPFELIYTDLISPHDELLQTLLTVRDFKDINTAKTMMDIISKNIIVLSPIFIVSHEEKRIKHEYLPPNIRIDPSSFSRAVPYADTWFSLSHPPFPHPSSHPPITLCCNQTPSFTPLSCSYISKSPADKFPLFGPSPPMYEKYKDPERFKPHIIQLPSYEPKRGRYDPETHKYYPSPFTSSCLHSISVPQSSPNDDEEEEATPHPPSHDNSDEEEEEYIPPPPNPPKDDEPKERRL